MVLTCMNHIKWRDHLWGRITRKDDWWFIESVMAPFFTNSSYRKLFFVSYMLDFPAIWLIVLLCAFYLRVTVVHVGMPWKIKSKINFYNFFIAWMIINVICDATSLFWFHWELLPSWPSHLRPTQRRVLFSYDAHEWLTLASRHEMAFAMLTIDIFILIAAIVFKKRLYSLEEEEITPKKSNSFFGKFFTTSETTSTSTSTEIIVDSEKKKQLVKVLYMGTEPYAFLVRLSLIHLTSSVCVYTESFFIFPIFTTLLLFLLFNTVRKFGHFKNVKDGVYHYDPRLIHSCYHLVPRNTPAISKKLYCYDPIDIYWVKWSVYKFGLFIISLFFIPLAKVWWDFITYYGAPTYQPFLETKFVTLYNYKNTKLYMENLFVALNLISPLTVIYLIYPLWLITEKRPFETVQITHFMGFILQAVAYHEMRRYMMNLFRYIELFLPIDLFLFYILILLLVIIYKKFFRRDMPWTPIIWYTCFTLIELALYMFYFDKSFITFYKQIIKPKWFLGIVVFVT